MSDQKHAGDTPSQDRTPRPGVPSGSTQKDSEGESAILAVRPAAACSLGSAENPEVLPCRRSLEGCPADISSSLTSQQQCPVSGRVIPSLPQIEKVIEKSLVLLNWRWMRSVAVRGIALALHRWACEVGLERAHQRARMILEDQELKYADLANLPWISKDQIEPLTSEQFAERLGGIVDDVERRQAQSGAAEDDGGGDQRLLPGAGDPHQGGGAGSEPSAEGEAGGGSGHGDRGAGEGGRVVAFPTYRRNRHGAPEGLSRRLALEELTENQFDLRAFQDAYTCISRRVQAVKDEGRLLKLVNWSGTAAVMGSLELATHAMERTVEELKSILSKIDSGVIPNLDEGDDG